MFFWVKFIQMSDDGGSEASKSILQCFPIVKEGGGISSRTDGQ